MKITVEISDERIQQLIEGAGSSYWASNFEWGEGLSFSLTEDLSDDNHEDVLHTVTADSIRLGLTKMAAAPRREGGHHFEDCMEDGNDDMYTGDALIQFACFGELKYG